MADTINFRQGSTDLLADYDEAEKKIEFIKSKITELFNMKNIYFLFGSGTSNGAIPVMKDLFSKVKDNVAKLDKEQVALFDNIKLKGENDFEELLGRAKSDLKGESLLLRQSALNVLKFFGRTSAGNAERVLQLISGFEYSANPQEKEIFDLLFFEFDL